ncbi:MAG: hypothetical protein Q8Q60_02300 [Candidatus Chromulinivorax sp.]|nr:hypothetical protein [Candidatus Chromulinivorax sp.]
MLGNLKKITLLIMIIIIEQISYCSMHQQPLPNNTSYLYKKNIDHAFHLAANRLTEESYISPELQRDLLGCFGKKDITINLITGTMQDVPSDDRMLTAITKRLNDNSYRNPIMYAEKELIKNALHAILEATDIAIFVTSLEAAYRNQQYIFYQNVDALLTEKLTAQKTNIQNMLTRVNELQPSDQPQSATSLFSWFGTPPVNTTSNYLGKPVHFSNHAETVTIPADIMDAIVKKNNYKQEPDADLAANLLFKQCFIAQQHHLKDALWIDQITLQVQSPITPDNYIFTNFPNIQRMCEIAQNLTTNSPIRTDLQAPMTSEQATSHRLLLHIRQAIQTAMYIANAKSNYNIGYVLPTFVVRQLGGIVNQLLVYDAQLSELCKNPMYGATEDDSYSDKNRSAITNVAAGVITLAAIAGTLYVATPAAIIGSVAKLGSAVYSLTGNALWYADGVSIDTMKLASKVPTTLKNIGTVGQNVMAVAGTVTLAAGGVKTADKQGYISLDQLDPNARHIVDAVYQYGMAASAVGGTAAAAGALGGTLDSSGRALNKTTTANNGFFIGKNEKGESEWISGRLYNAGKAAWDLQAAATQAASVGTTAVGGALYLANQLSSDSGTQNNPQPGQPQQQAITTEKVANVLTQLITDNAKDGTNPLPQIEKISKKLLENGAITEQGLQQAFTQTERNLHLPENAILHGLQSLENNASQSQQPQQ